MAVPYPASSISRFWYFQGVNASHSPMDAGPWPVILTTTRGISPSGVLRPACLAHSMGLNRLLDLTSKAMPGVLRRSTPGRPAGTASTSGQIARQSSARRSSLLRPLLTRESVTFPRTLRPIRSACRRRWFVMRGLGAGNRTRTRRGNHCGSCSCMDRRSLSAPSVVEADAAHGGDSQGCEDYRDERFCWH
jgi:hypothetical protein